MHQFLKSLRQRRSAIQAGIDDEQARPVPDQLRLSTLKRLKLRLRDQIEFIERMNRRGVAPVVARPFTGRALPAKVAPGWHRLA